jgi:hypothetical protein
LVTNLEIGVSIPFRSQVLFRDPATVAEDGTPDLKDLFRQMPPAGSGATSETREDPGSSAKPEVVAIPITFNLLRRLDDALNHPILTLQVRGTNDTEFERTVGSVIDALCDDSLGQSFCEQLGGLIAIQQANRQLRDGRGGGTPRDPHTPGLSRSSSRWVTEVLESTGSSRTGSEENRIGS